MVSILIQLFANEIKVWIIKLTFVSFNERTIWKINFVFNNKRSHKFKQSEMQISILGLIQIKWVIESSQMFSGLPI